MDFTDDQARLLRDLVMEAVIRRQRTGQPIPDRVRGLLAYMSTGGRPTEPSAAHLNQDSSNMIDTEQAAAILGCSTRHVRRLTADLEAQNLSGRWVFNSHTVTDYAEQRNTRCPRTPSSAA